MEQKHKVFNLIILDASGSMMSVKNATISGFNEVVQSVKGVQKQYPEQEHFVSLVSFNSSEIRTILALAPVEQLREINAKSYEPDAMTPLYDAMGFTISKLKSEVSKLNNYNVLVTILTDGMENASREFSGAAIKSLVDELSLQNWTFTYIGANHDVEKFALNISITNTMTFEANEADMKKMFEKEKQARVHYSENIRQNKDFKKGFYDDSNDKG